jgi:hypothetical protein
MGLLMYGLGWVRMVQEDIGVGGRELNSEEGVGDEGGRERETGEHRWSHEPWDLWIE